MTTSDCNYRDNYYVITFTYVQLSLAHQIREQQRLNQRKSIDMMMMIHT